MNSSFHVTTTEHETERQQSRLYWKLKHKPIESAVERFVWFYMQSSTLWNEYFILIQKWDDPIQLKSVNIKVMKTYNKVIYQLRYCLNKLLSLLLNRLCQLHDTELW